MKGIICWCKAILVIYGSHAKSAMQQVAKSCVFWVSYRDRDLAYDGQDIDGATHSLPPRTYACQLVSKHGIGLPGIRKLSHCAAAELLNSVAILAVEAAHN